MAPDDPLALHLNIDGRSNVNHGNPARACVTLIRTLVDVGEGCGGGVVTDREVARRSLVRAGRSSAVSVTTQCVRQAVRMIRLVLDNRGTPPDGGFELGHVTVRCGDNVHSSRGSGSRGLVMVYLAATDLLDGARLLLAHPDSSYVFTGVGSGWSFTVRRTRHRGLQITTPRGTTLGVVPERDYLTAVWNGVQKLITERPPAQSAASSDLFAAIDAYPTACKPPNSRS